MTASGGRRDNAVFLVLIAVLAGAAIALLGARVLSPGGDAMSTGFPSASHDAGYAKAAVRFGDALVREDFDAAHAMLSRGLHSELSAAALRARYEEMIEYGDGPASSTQLITTMEDWPDRQPNDAGWAYVSIEGPEFMEAVAVIVEQAGDALTIRDIEWGRP